MENSAALKHPESTLDIKEKVDFLGFCKVLFTGEAAKRFNNAKLVSDYLGMITRFGFIWGLFVWINVNPQFITESLRWPNWYYWPLYVSTLVFAFPMGVCLVTIPLMLLYSEVKWLREDLGSKVATIFYAIWLVSVAGIIAIISFQPIFQALTAKG
ncbi:hypothetical protein [Rhizobium tropici]|uniref:Uncharacterized protein n=1 Tax=Rhizobium tropici TaxID=398 RepID=A0A329YH40_RHITR|nr:hypothetical protein [Rhizobium tropici]RAX43469.1 hypothetical protein DQ393_00225 [Rhizobium tropici]